VGVRYSPTVLFTHSAGRLRPTFGSNQLLNGRPYFLQSEYSNTKHMCTSEARHEPRGSRGSGRHYPTMLARTDSEPCTALRIAPAILLPPWEEGSIGLA
jgi:hypothetical protein